MKKLTFQQRRKRIKDSSKQKQTPRYSRIPYIQKTMKNEKRKKNSSIR